MADSKPGRLVTPRFRVSFPSVFQKASYNGGTERFSLTALFFPKLFTEGEKKKWKAILAALDQVSMEAFKKPMAQLDRGVYKTPFHKGDEKEYEGYGDPDMRYCSLANSKRKPEILDYRTKREITDANSDLFYAGCWARASVNPYAFNNIGKGLALGLGNIEKLKDDKSFEGFTKAKDDFADDISDEFGEAGTGDEFDGSDDLPSPELAEDDFGV